MPVPSATNTAVAAPAAAPKCRSASAAALASCSTTTGSPMRSAIRSATGRVPPRQVRREPDDPPVGRDEPGQREPDGRDPVPARERVHHARDRRLQRRLAARGRGAGGVEDGAVAVDDARPHAGAADVDADGERHRPPPRGALDRYPLHDLRAARRGALRRRRARRVSSRAERSSVTSPPRCSASRCTSSGRSPRSAAISAHSGQAAQVSRRHRGGRLDAQPVQHGLDPVQRRARERRAARPTPRRARRTQGIVIGSRPRGRGRTRRTGRRRPAGPR